MIDDETSKALQDLAERGTPRGADAVWAAATREVAAQDSRPGSSAASTNPGPLGLRLAAAAVLIALALGGWWWWARQVAPTTIDAASINTTTTSTDTAPIGTTSTATATPTDAAQPPAEAAPTPDRGASQTEAELQATTTPPPTTADPPAEEPVDGQPGAEDPTGELRFSTYGLMSNATGTGSPETGWTLTVEPGDEPGAAGGVVVTDGRAHGFEAGQLIVEVPFAAVVEGRGDSAWGEVVITSAPTLDAVDGSFYAASRADGHPALGCRLQVDRAVVCQLFAADGSRIWQMSWFESVGAVDESTYDETSWTICDSGQDPQTCLDTFRLELTPDSVTVRVNDKIHLRQLQTPPLPAELTDGAVYVHAASVFARHGEPTARYDWGPLTVGAR